MLDRSMIDVLGGVVMTALLLWAAGSDLRSGRIPNTLVLLLAGFGLVYVLLAQRTPAALLGWAGGLALGLALWLPLYLFGMLGAGDVKLFAAAAGWLGPMGALRGALLCAIAGGAASLVFMVVTRTTRATSRNLRAWALLAAMGRFRPPVPAEEARHQLPYGVAMAVGLSVAWWLPQLLPLQ